MKILTHKCIVFCQDHYSFLYSMNEFVSSFAWKSTIIKFLFENNLCKKEMEKVKNFEKYIFSKKIKWSPILQFIYSLKGIKF